MFESHIPGKSSANITIYNNNYHYSNLLHNDGKIDFQYIVSRLFIVKFLWNQSPLLIKYLTNHTYYISDTIGHSKT